MSGVERSDAENLRFFAMLIGCMQGGHALALQDFIWRVNQKGVGSITSHLKLRLDSENANTKICYWG